ncbi:HU family DNA-binding protein [Pseudomonas panipatensis]|uniref:DNA-binding protein HU-beta n=1 Tax=Pseudomonas panipatensis TaxID=428992 RepID=A0A1G8FIT3_9PSED|nr:HU family DNA-binding protein [Pseudomonas panipatensis]SDH82012.1 DNA-binding protein HU-beta [Pseudomonas panipatensis]SMP53440.1 DNA-binding protein HU-beta [Pseudomonas panipatensis]
MALTKDQLVRDIADSLDLTQAAVRGVFEQLAQIVQDSLENGEELTLPGIGKLKVAERAARSGRNPQTGKTIQIAAKKVVRFVPAKALADSLN